MIFDAAAYVGDWPFRDIGGTVRDLVRMMAANGLTHALVSPLQGFFYSDPAPANERLLRELRGRENLFAAPVLNPYLVNSVDQIARFAEDSRVRAIRLAPGFHGYELAFARPLVEAAAARRLPVIVQTKFQDRRHHPSVANMPEVPLAEVLDLAAAVPKARVVAAAAHFVELTREAERIRELPNVWLDLSHLDGLECIKRAAEAVGAKRLLLSTCWPFFYAEAARLKVAEAELAASEEGLVLGGNAGRVFGGS
jgi:predicted TIM-barrel fold metal-dependent hydrolase